MKSAVVAVDDGRHAAAVRSDLVGLDTGVEHTGHHGVTDAVNVDLCVGGAEHCHCLVDGATHDPQVAGEVGQICEEAGPAVEQQRLSGEVGIVRHRVDPSL